MTAARRPGPGRRIRIKLESTLRKKLRLGHSLSELDPGLAARELVFHAPPLTAGTIEAVRLISPQFHLRDDEASRRFWELNQNGLCWGEYLALAPYLDGLARPSKVLDIGPGLGRSAVFFKKVRGWETVPFHLYEGSGSETKYTRAGSRFDDSFCGSPEVLTAMLRYNEIEGFELFDAHALGASLARLPGPYDFVYSFFAVGFHWSIEHFLDDLLGLMSDAALGAFTLHDRFDNFAALEHLPHRVVEFQSSWPRDRWWRMLLLAKHQRALEAGPPG